MQLVVFVQPTGHLSVLRGKNFSVGHFAQTFQPNFVMPVILIGIIALYNFLLHSLTLILAEGHKVSTKQKAVGFIFSYAFQQI